MRRLKLTNKIGKFIVISQMFLLASAFAQTKSPEKLEAKAKPITAVGLVVDDLNNPIKGAVVSFNAPHYGDVVPSFETDREGVFQVSHFVRTKHAKLVIEGPLPDSFTTAAISQDRISQFPEFSGLKLKVPRDPKFVYQLGYINPHITYKKVELDLTKLFEGNFVKDTYELKYSVDYKKIRIANNIYVDDRDFDYKTKKLTWAFPTGKWKLTISLESGGQKRVQEFPLSLM